jgi:hypothetical protein
MSPRHPGPARAEGERTMSSDYRTCKLCSGKVPLDHQGQTCPLCGKETSFAYVMRAEPGQYAYKGQPLTLTHIAERLKWSWPYLVIFVLATVGSMIFCFVPGWGVALGAACTIIATFTGFKAGMKYHKEITR